VCGVWQKSAYVGGAIFVPCVQRDVVALSDKRLTGPQTETIR
jgi:hypothetical protein